MATKDTGHFVVLFSDVPGDEERVRAVLADWGVEERAIRSLLAEERKAQTVAANDATQTNERQPCAGH